MLVDKNRWRSALGYAQSSMQAGKKKPVVTGFAQWITSFDFRSKGRGLDCWREGSKNQCGTTGINCYQ
jgi:hypothetical protein